jgi:hypothetical protein
MLAILYDETLYNCRVYRRYSYIEYTLSQGVQIDSHSLERFGGRLAIRAAKFGPKADRTIWRVGGIYNGGILDFETKNEGPLREQ